MPSGISDLEAKRASQREATRRWRERNPERARELARIRNADPVVREKKRVYDEKYRAEISADPVALERRRAAGREKARRYYERNAEQVRARSAARQKIYDADPVKLGRKREYARKRVQVYRYGITPADHAAMMDSQGGVCAICNNPPKPGKKLHVDHCHSTEVVRGLLCRSCNVAIGFFRESAETMLKAIEYLASPPGVPQADETEVA